MTIPPDPPPLSPAEAALFREIDDLAAAYITRCLADPSTAGRISPETARLILPVIAGQLMACFDVLGGDCSPPISAERYWQEFRLELARELTL